MKGAYGALGFLARVVDIVVAVVAVIIATGVLLVVHLASPAGMGFGDVKLGVPLGFAVGATGVLMHRHPVAMLMAVELMLNAANLLIVLGARVHGLADAESAALIVLVLAAAEAVIGLALALAFFRRRALPDVDDAAELRG